MYICIYIYIRPPMHSAFARFIFLLFFFFFYRPRKREQSEGAGGVGEDGSVVGGGGSKAALLRKSLNDKGWAEKQTAGFTNWLNFTLVGAEQPGLGGGDEGQEDDGEGFTAEMRGVSSSPLKAMVAMVSVLEGGEGRTAIERFGSVVLLGLTHGVQGLCACVRACVRAWLGDCCREGGSVDLALVLMKATAFVFFALEE